MTGPWSTGGKVEREGGRGVAVMDDAIGEIRLDLRDLRTRIRNLTKRGIPCDVEIRLAAELEEMGSEVAP